MTVRRMVVSLRPTTGTYFNKFLEADLKTSLPRQFHFKSPDKIIELVHRGGGFPDQESRMMLDQGIEKGRDGVFLNLTAEQYGKLKD